MMDKGSAPVAETYLLEQTHAETYFSLSCHPVDLCPYEPKQNAPVVDVMGATPLMVERVKSHCADTTTKWMRMRYVHESPVRVEAVTELGD